MMIHTTGDFRCPTGAIVIKANYDDVTKVVSFEVARGYMYTQDMSTMQFSIQADAFIKEKETTVESIQKANDYLTELGIDKHFSVPDLQKEAETVN
jgi:hypothetical protein